MRQLLHPVAFFLEAISTAFLAQFEERNPFGGIVYNHQGTFFVEAFHLEVEGRAVDGLVQQQAVVDVDGYGVALKTIDQRDGIVFGIVTFSVLALEAHAHVGEEDNHEDDGKGQDAVAYHELFVGVQAVGHSSVFSFFSRQMYR